MAHIKFCIFFTFSAFSQDTNLQDFSVIYEDNGVTVYITKNFPVHTLKEGQKIFFQSMSAQEIIFLHIVMLVCRPPGVGKWRCV